MELDSDFSRGSVSEDDSSCSITRTQARSELETSQTTVATSASSLIDRSWDRCIPIPGSKRKQVIYPGAPVEKHPWSREEWLEQFVYVKTQLEVLVHKYLQLPGYGRKPTYMFRMVGTSLSDAGPSVVVICRDIDLKSIRDIFRSKAERELHLKRDSPVSPLRQILIRRNESNRPAKPRLQLVYFQTKTQPLIRNALKYPVSVRYTDHDASCGSLARFGDITATIGITLALPETTAFLTVDHLFGGIEADEGPSHARECLSTTGLRTPMSPLSSFSGVLQWDDDDEYESLDSSSTGLLDIDTPQLPFISDSALEETGDVKVQDPTGWDARLWERVDLPRMLDSPAPFLDWALIQPETPSDKSPRNTVVNTVYPPRCRGKAVVLRDYETSPPAYLATVYVISGIRGILYGELITAPTYLPSPGDRESCEAWSVLLGNHSDGMLVSILTTQAVYAAPP